LIIPKVSNKITHQQWSLGSNFLPKK